ncbi:hypothetical protein SCP_0606710 [Sparassis crispa]|uniref:Uncharacterized protein n=1 Tax=Sparassis crispa TaxID=139825 RepID=A0A401GR47_9APHY|nr:hypothetical protein SCP_0606710 [Sparassis crispa]GBE84692.1 hypothetical protein SCP_0606710 [Sparassis crispa]
MHPLTAFGFPDSPNLLWHVFGALQFEPSLKPRVGPLRVHVNEAWDACFSQNSSFIFCDACNSASHLRHSIASKFNHTNKRKCRNILRSFKSIGASAFPVKLQTRGLDPVAWIYEVLNVQLGPCLVLRTT